jgi:hypothetical protein
MTVSTRGKQGGTRRILNPERFLRPPENAGCSKCRFRGCRKCRGYTLRELKQWQAEQNGEEDLALLLSSDTHKNLGNTGPASIKGSKRRRDPILTDDVSLETRGLSGDGESRKKSRWGLDKLSNLTSKVMSVVSAPLSAFASFSLWGGQQVNICDDDAIQPGGEQFEGAAIAADEDGNASEQNQNTSEDTETKHRVLEETIFRRPTATVELCVSNPQKAILSRSQLKKQLLEKVKSSSPPDHRDHDGHRPLVCVGTKKENTSCQGPGNGGNSRGSRILELLPENLPRNSGESNARRFSEFGKVKALPNLQVEVECFQVSDDLSEERTPTPEASFSFADMIKDSGDQGQEQEGGLQQEEQGPSSNPAANSEAPDFAFSEVFGSPEGDSKAVSRAMGIVQNLVSELDMSPEKPNSRYKAELPQFINSDDADQGDPAQTPVTYVVPDSMRQSCFVIENHTAHLSPEDGSPTEIKSPNLQSNCAHHISSLAAEQGSMESAKHLLRKRMTLKQATQDAIYLKVREVVLNRHLAEAHRQGCGWASLDACGVPLDATLDHAAMEEKVLGSVLAEHGEHALHKIVSQVEEEWERMCSVRKKYAEDANRSCKGQTPTRSILRHRSPPGKLKPSIRWATENVQHTYNVDVVHGAGEKEQAVRPPTSTRGLRMLGLASASPKVAGQPTNAPKLSPNMHPKIGSRRRSRTGSAVPRPSQGHRLFQALQNASCSDSQPATHTPRTLAMIFDSLPDDNEHSNNTSSATTSDQTTSSTSSRGSTGGRWSQEEVECLIKGFKEWSSAEDRHQFPWKFIGDSYRGRGISDCRTNDDLSGKWKAMRKTAGRNRRMRYVQLSEDALEFLRSDASIPVKL